MILYSFHPHFVQIADEAMKQLQPRTHESDGPIVVHEREQTKKMEEAAQAPIQETVQKETKTKACQSPIIIDEAFDDDKEILSSHKEIIVVGDQGWYSVMVPK